MSDEYICSICGHRAGDHAVSNRCLAVDCDCKDDPYDEQLDTLRKQLIELQADKVELISQRDNWIGLVMDKNKQLEDALIGSIENADWFDCLKIDYDIIKKQLEVAVEAINTAHIKLHFNNGNYARTDVTQNIINIIEDALAEIERLRGKDE